MNLNEIPNEMIDKIIIYSYSFIWNDIHTNLRIHFGVINRKRSLEWIIFKKLIKYYYINGRYINKIQLADERN